MVLSLPTTMSDEPRYRDEEWLRQKYHGEKLTYDEIASLCDCSKSVIGKWVKSHDIEPRSISEARLLAVKDDRPEWATEERLRELYWDKMMSVYEIADRVGYSHQNVQHHLNRTGVNTRSLAEANRIRDGEKKYHDDVWLRDQYVEQGKSTVKLAEELNTSSSAIRYWLIKHGIPVREFSEAQQNRDQSGENHPRWNGGRAYYYGPNWYRQRDKAIQRDNQKCRICGMKNGEHKEKFDQELHVHHIKRFADFDSHKKANKLTNLITLCRDHHYQYEGLPLDVRDN